MKTSSTKTLFALALLVLLGSCAAPSARSYELSIGDDLLPASSSVKETATEKIRHLRSPYGLADRVGYGYAYRHWTW